MLELLGQSGWDREPVREGRLLSQERSNLRVIESRMIRLAWKFMHIYRLLLIASVLRPLASSSLTFVASTSKERGDRVVLSYTLETRARSVI